MKSWLRQPSLHFLLLGAALYGLLHGPLARHWTPVAPIEISAADIERLRVQWREQWASEPTPAQFQQVLQRYTDDEVLLREALRLQLDSRDKVARERMIRNMRFAFPETQDDDDTLLRKAQKLNMAERDPVVRQRLVQAMEHRIAGSIAISDVEMQDYLQRHLSRYASPVRYDFRQLYFDGDSAQAAARAQAALATLRAGGAVPPGDPFLLGQSFHEVTAADIRRDFGAALADAVTGATPGQWSGPLTSVYGQHLILLQRQITPPPPDFAALRQRLAYALLEEKSRHAVRDALPALRARYGLADVALNGGSR